LIFFGIFNILIFRVGGFLLAAATGVFFFIGPSAGDGKEKKKKCYDEKSVVM
jgi:hypothetical protein